MGANATATSNGAVPKVYTDTESRQAAFHKATDHLLFTKDFNTALEAWRDDPLEPLAGRFLAWAKRTSWGRYSLYCVNEDGTPAYQVKAAEELGVDRKRVWDTVDYLFKRGVLGKDGKLLYPVISPVLADNSFKSDQKSGEYRTFLEQWKVAHSADFQELEVARSTVKRLEKVKLSLYKEWRASRTNGGPSLYKKKEEFKEEEVPPPPPPISEPVAPAVEEEEDVDLQSTETPTPTQPPPNPYRELKASYPKQRFDEAKAKPVFCALPPPEQKRALRALRERYLTCERWLDEGGKWIPFASKWLNEKQYDADPPPKWSKQQNRGGRELAPVDEVLALMRRNREAT